MYRAMCDSWDHIQRNGEQIGPGTKTRSYSFVLLTVAFSPQKLVTLLTKRNKIYYVL